MIELNADPSQPNEDDLSVDVPLKFSIRLLICHPTLDPESFTSEIGVLPISSQRVGTPRKTPRGTELPGVYRESKWSCIWETEGARYFFTELRKIINMLLPHADLLKQVTTTGGSANLIVDLSGRSNIGDTLHASELRLLAELNIDLGIEVFPDYN